MTQLATVISIAPRLVRECHPDGPFHDCGYVNQRDRLIPYATAIATAAHPNGAGEYDPVQEREAWSRTFHASMTRMAKEAGLTR